VAVTTWLNDKSALVRLSASDDAQLWADRIGRGLIRITTVTLVEVGSRPDPDPTEQMALAANSVEGDTADTYPE
jgi:predicted nucleic acid-binding protein